MDDDIKMTYKQTLKFKFPRIDVMFAIKCYNTGGAYEYYPDPSVAPYYLTDIRATILITSDDGIEGSDQGGWNVGHEDSYVNAVNAPTSTTSDLTKTKINWDFKDNLYTTVGGPPNTSFYNVFDSNTITFYDVEGYSYYENIKEIALILWSETGTGIGYYEGAGQYNDLGFIPDSGYFILGRNVANSSTLYGSSLVEQPDTDLSNFSHFYLMQVTHAVPNSTFGRAKYWAKLPIWNSSDFNPGVTFKVDGSLLGTSSSYFGSVGQEWSNKWGSGGDTAALGYCLVYEISSDTWKENGFG